LTYFKLIEIGGKIGRPKLQINFSLFLTTSCENGVLGPKKVTSSV
jgi:hypothetical protein